MRLLALAFALPFLAGSATAEPRDEAPAERQAGILLDHLRTGEASCRDRIIALRAERGLPPLELRRDNAAPGEAEALHFYAVDRDIDGCDVLVMADDPRDVRPLPSFAREDWQVRPAPHRRQ